MTCPNVNFVVDNMPPRFVYINATCNTIENNNSQEELSWDIQALSGIVAIRYNISNTNPNTETSQLDFVPFPMNTPVGAHQLDYNLQPLLQDYSGNIYFTLQAENGVGLTATNTIQADFIC